VNSGIIIARVIFGYGGSVILPSRVWLELRRVIDYKILPHILQQESSIKASSSVFRFIPSGRFWF
jgi:hypothetical protein